MEKESVVMNINDFAKMKAEEWKSEFDNPSKLPTPFDDNPDIGGILYKLATDLIDELSPTVVHSLSIDTIRVFLIAQEKGYEPNEIILCYLTSPTHRDSFKMLKSFYDIEDTHNCEETIH